VRERLRTALGNARDNERALKRMAGAEQDCSVAHRGITVSIGSAGDAARNMCRAVHTTNAALPATDDHITVLGNEFARELQAYDALLAEAPDDARRSTRSSLWLEAKKLRLADRKRSLTELSARLALLDRDVARHREQQSAFVRDLRRSRPARSPSWRRASASCAARRTRCSSGRRRTSSATSPSSCPTSTSSTRGSPSSSSSSPAPRTRRSTRSRRAARGSRRAAATCSRSSAAPRSATPRCASRTSS
jgi:hypothetical protein